VQPGQGPAPSTGYLVWQLATRWRVGLDRALAPLGLTASRYGVLASLYGFSRAGIEPSQRELADFAGLEPMYMSKILRALERAGLVERAIDSRDPRARRLTITERGVEAATAGRKVVLALEEQRLLPLGGRSSARSAELRATLQELLRHAIDHKPAMDGENE
jgi:MarR family transcriptional regulator, organic hydroperoxide resistance regulator